MTIRRGIALAAVLALMALTLAACGDDDGAGTTEAPETTTTTEASTTTASSTTTAAPTTTAAVTTTAGEGGGDTTGTTIEVVTQGDRFSEDEIRVKAGEEVTIRVIDKDTETDAPHNFHVRAGDQDFFTNIEEAPNTQEITFTIQEPGEYEFFCDTHSLTMNGVFIVEP